MSKKAKLTPRASRNWMISGSLAVLLVSAPWWLAIYSQQSIQAQIGFFVILVAMIAFVLITGTIELVRAKKHGVLAPAVD